MASANELPEANITDLDDQSLFLRPARGEMLRVMILGALIGLLIPFIGFLLEKFFIGPVFCSAGSGTGMCTNAANIGYYAASVVFGGLTVVVLANWQVFRPLVIAAAAIAALWGFRRYVQDLVGGNGLEYYLLSTVLYAAAYLLFYWLMRIRQFAVSLVLAVVIVVLVRWALLA